MPLAPSDFLPPEGDLEEALFAEEGDDLDAFLGAWIEDAEGRAEAAGISAEGRAARAWVEHRAYALLARRALGAVERVDVEGEGSVTYAKNRAAELAALRDAALARAGVLASAYDEAEAAVAAPPLAVVRSLR
ncbi:MAG TPA: hypothetical protein VD838_00505 [Anaeromyxobacteraceae bacterium]|nr:hypothetical protein [Anaeromyxobacteraceae bacterium]